MPRTKKVESSQPDVTSVRSLVKSVTKLANHLKLSAGTIYRMINLNRIPAEHIIKVAAFYDVDVGSLIHLSYSDKKSASTVKLKDRSVLPALLEVQARTKTLAEASAETGHPEKGLKLVLINWGENLKDLYDTLEALDKKEISLDTACQQLNVTKYTMHGIRRKYGYAPGALKRVRPEPTIKLRKSVLRQAALDVISGKDSAVGAAKAAEVSSRNLFREIEKISPLSISELSHFPVTFRLAYADEVGQNHPKYVEKWLEYAKNSRFFVKKRTPYPKTPPSWKDQPLKRLLLAVLLGEATLEEVAEGRGADPDILANLFTSDLRSLDLTYPEVKEMSMNHQLALAELLLWQMDRKRTFDDQ